MAQSKKVKPTYVNVPPLPPRRTMSFDDAIRLRKFLREIDEDVFGEIQFDGERVGTVGLEGGQRFVKLEPWVRESLSDHRLLPWRA